MASVELVLLRKLAVGGIMNKISIVLPVYNTKQYIAECLESIKNQSYKNFEVIMIDDCSNDTSDLILKDYSKKDCRFIYVKNEVNSGPSFSRNVGINKSSGEYLFFVDSDDVLNTTCLEKLLDSLIKNNADLSVCGFEMFTDSVDNETTEPNEIIFDNDSLMKELAICTRIQNFAWGKLYKKELFDGVEFPNGRYFEDIRPTYMVFSKCSKAIYLNENLYYYRQNPNSISKTLNDTKVNDYFLFMEEKGKFIQIKYNHILKYMSQSFFELFYLLKEQKISKTRIQNYDSTKQLYKEAIKKAPLKQKIRFLIAVL